uniref:Coiled-coil domain-containing protein 103 n=1 Tax=Tetraselmis sp. GSL018 TaxID=582737 RepID=A0A061SGS5_9CHLO|mmetsp:Transcript_42423/g.100678  ORF Transcript_42423/g.100678 Transcript_42423/m.100678 type:complete len:194 (-) Transcript_42423:654-1235(-)
MVPAWEFAADGRKRAPTQFSGGESALCSSAPREKPSSAGDFEREWRRNCKSANEKYGYLRLCGPELLKALFKVEVSAGVLSGILQAVDEAWLTFAAAADEGAGGSALEEADFVARALESIAASGRFSLTVRLVGADGKRAAGRILGNLEAAVAAAEAQRGGGLEDEQGAAPPPRSGASLTAENLSSLRKLYNV